MKLLICACAAVYGLVWAVRHPCRTMRGVWVRRGIGLLCFALALIPVFFLAGHAGVRQEALYDFQEDSVREAYRTQAFLREDADFYSQMCIRDRSSGCRAALYRAMPLLMVLATRSALTADWN